MDEIGCELYLPEGREHQHCTLYSTEPVMGEITFKLPDYEMVFCYRVQQSSTSLDISGIYLDDVLDEDSCQVGSYSGICRRGTLDGATVDICQWYDEENQMMYSLSTQADDLDGFDIEAIAEMMIP